MKGLIAIPSAILYEPRSTNPLKKVNGVIINPLSIIQINKNHSLFTGATKHQVFMPTGTYYIDDKDLKKITDHYLIP
jgi:hypothetical protein